MSTKSDRDEVIRLKGRSVMRGWRRGALQALMDQGMTLQEAQVEAERQGCLDVVSVADNLIVSVGKGLVGDLLIDVENGGLSHHEIGTGTATPTLADTALQTVAERKAWTTRDRSANVITLSVFYTSAEATYAIEEAGVWGGDAATLTEGTGTLFSRYLQSYDNSAGNVDLTFDYTLTIG